MFSLQKSFSDGGVEQGVAGEGGERQHRLHVQAGALVLAAPTDLTTESRLQFVAGGHAELLQMGGAGVMLTIGYICAVTAMRVGDVAFIAPFRYTSLLWAVLLGMLFFNETPDVWMVVGSAIVIGSGLYTFYRESKKKAALARRADPASPG